MSAFHVGDIVEAAVDYPEYNDFILTGDIGTICCFEHGSRGRIGVSWEKEFDGGHNCNGNCENGHGWYVPSDTIRLHEEDSDIDINEDSFLEIIAKA